MSTTDVKKYFGQRLKQLRGDLSQDQLADALGVAQVDVWRWETGKTIPRAERVESIARFFKVDTSFLLSLHSKPEGSHPILKFLSDQVGVTESEFLERLLKDHGAGLMQKMQAERKNQEPSPTPLKPEVEIARASMDLAEEKANIRNIGKH